MKKLPIDISTFSRIIQEGYLYVDKTQYIYQLFNSGARYYFLSRPRRFGKSLLVSTLKELFLGNRELFKGLWIDKQKDFPWVKHPVVHLDFSDADSSSAEALTKSLGQMLDDIAEHYGLSIPKRLTPKAKLKKLVIKLAEENLVVILIDEYDKPILDAIKDSKKAQELRAVLKSFYDGFKGIDAYMRAIFITGVSKFSKTSIFSGLNNLNEISNEEEGALLAGYSQEELQENFSDYIKQVAQDENSSFEATLEKIRFWYNGYQFSRAEIKVYNPFSIAYLFFRRRFENYWFESGTPTFLTELFKKNPHELETISQKGFTLATLGTFRIEKIPFVTLLFQTGYLTIKEYDKQFKIYRLGMPNEEVRQSLSLLEMGALTDTEIIEVENALYQLRYALEHKDIDTFITTLKGLFASIPYTLLIDREAYYHSLFQLLCTLLGFENRCELLTNKGRIDLTVTTAKYIYLFEFKFNKSGKEALAQIKRNGYDERYRQEKKEIVLVGVTFNSKNKDLTIDYATSGGVS